MDKAKEFHGSTEAAVWQQVENDLQQEENMLTYTALLNQNGQETLLHIDIDPGGGFESGISTTMFRARTPTPVSLRFHVREQDLLNEVGKMFGMEDIQLGYPDFDKAFIVQTNQPETVKALFADGTLRQTLLKHPDATLKLSTDHDSEDTYLLFSKDDAIAETAELREVYQLLQKILAYLKPANP